MKEGGAEKALKTLPTPSVYYMSKDKTTGLYVFSVKLPIHGVTEVFIHRASPVLALWKVMYRFGYDLDEWVPAKDRPKRKDVAFELAN